MINQTGLPTAIHTDLMYQKLMLLYQVNGQADLARATFEHCQRIFQAELGVEPMEETRRIAFNEILPDF